VHESVIIRQQAMEQGRRPERVWRPLRKNPRALGCIIAAICLCVAIRQLDQWACLGQDCGEFNWDILAALFEGRPIVEVWDSVDRIKIWMRYVVDYVLIGVYVPALSWLAIYARRALADRTQSVTVHTVAYWMSLIPLWALLASDVLENAVALFLLRKPAGIRVSYVMTTGLLAGFTLIKLLTFITIDCLLCWLAVYQLTHKKQDVIHACP
jgi:hypothetical protein